MTTRRTTQKTTISRASRVGVREFRSKLPQYVTGERLVEVQRHGKPVAFLLPIHQPQTPADRRAMLQAAADAFTAVRENLNMTEDELAALVGGKSL